MAWLPAVIVWLILATLGTPCMALIIQTWWIPVLSGRATPLTFTLVHEWGEETEIVLRQGCSNSIEMLSVGGGGLLYRCR